MRDFFQEQLNELKRELTIMGSNCEEIIALASQALTDWNEECSMRWSITFATMPSSIMFQAAA